MNSDRCAGSFSVPMLPGGTAANVDFHAVAYRGGDGVGNVNVDGTPWTVSTAGGVTWRTQDASNNPNANALRWSTLYNFRFDSTSPPADGGGTVLIGLWRPGMPSSG